MRERGASPFHGRGRGVASIDELTVNWEENGELRVKELHKHVLEGHGAWATVLFRFSERAADGGWRAPKVQIRRYQKRKAGFVFHSKFTVPNDEQGLEIARVLEEWCRPEES
jgi:hypothetical protein